ncbi:hypothetical protein GbCGDNIH2_7143 [Granulibacter bethesdensis]|nr:hypothetical protein GbCGDNIH2_7143 [Granulibacter bethesdensis]
MAPWIGLLFLSDEAREEDGIHALPGGGKCCPAWCTAMDKAVYEL